MGSLFGSRLYYLPDGETGERLGWMGWLETIFANHPQFEKTGETVLAARQQQGNHQQISSRSGCRSEGRALRQLPQVRFAKNSYAEFERLKRAGKISRDVRFQVSLAGPISVIRRFLADESEQAARSTRL